MICRYMPLTDVIPKRFTCQIHGRVKIDTCYYCRDGRYYPNPYWHGEKKAVQLTFDF